MDPMPSGAAVPRISPRSTLPSSVNYVENSFQHCFEVNPGGRPGHANHEFLRERLSTLNKHANQLGFVSLYDACLAEARLRDRNGMAYQNIENFVSSGCLYELLDLFGTRYDKTDADMCHRVERVYVSEFDSIRRLDVLNQNASSWPEDFMSNFGFEPIHAAMIQAAPNLVRLFDILVTPQAYASPMALPSKYQRAVVMVIAILTKTRKPSANFVQIMFSIFLFAARVPKRVLGCLSHVGLCTSYSTVRTVLTQAAGTARSRLRRLGYGNKAFIPVFDNLTKQTNVRDRRLVNNPDFLTLSAGYVLLPHNSRSSPIFTRKDFRNDLIESLTVLDFLPMQDDFRMMKEAIMAMMASVVTNFATAANVELSDFHIPMPASFPLDHSLAPEILPLPTYDSNEGIVNEMIDLMYSMQKDVGLSKEQRLEALSLVGGDLGTVINIRRAQYQQAEASDDMTLQWAEATMGMFHVQMNILAQIFKTHYGADTDRWSLSRLIKVLGLDANKFWNKTESQVKDFNTCFDFFNIVLNGCILAAVSTRLCFPKVETIGQLQASVGSVLRPESMLAAITALSETLSDYRTVSSMRCAEVPNRDIGAENLLLFLQEGLMLRHLTLAMRQGDSGRIINALSYFTVWFQGTAARNYAEETLRLTACLRKLWSPQLRKFWMENGCVVNISGKREGFVALDMLNEYVVREVKSLISTVVTSQTDEHLRNVLSLLVMVFWDIRRKISEETEMYVFDYHSSKVNSLVESRKVADYILRSTLVVTGGEAQATQSDGAFEANDCFMSGVHRLSKTQCIAKLKRTLQETVGDMNMDLSDNSDSMSDGE